MSARQDPTYMFRNKTFAYDVADLMERMTGEKTRVEERGGYQWVLRLAGGRWVLA